MVKITNVKEIPSKIKIVSEKKVEKSIIPSLENNVSQESFSRSSSQDISPVLKQTNPIQNIQQSSSSRQESQKEESAFSYNPSLRSSSDSQNKYNPTIESNLPERMVRTSNSQTRSILPESRELSQRNQIDNINRENVLQNNMNEEARRYQDQTGIKERKRRTDFF